MKLVITAFWWPYLKSECILTLIFAPVMNSRHTMMSLAGTKSRKHPGWNVSCLSLGGWELGDMIFVVFFRYKFKNLRISRGSPEAIMIAIFLNLFEIWNRCYLGIVYRIFESIKIIT